MMYPRLKLARNLLADDGVICVSIDDNELVNLTKMLNEIFGETNHVNTFVWVSNLKGRQISGSGAVGTKEYIVCFSRKLEQVGAFRASGTTLKKMMPLVYKGFNYAVQEDEYGPYVLKNELYNTNSAFNEVTRPNLVFDIYYNPDSGDVKTESTSSTHVHAGYVKISPKQNNNGKNLYHAFRWSTNKVNSEPHNLAFVESPGGWKVFTKVRDVESTAVKDLIMDISTNDGSTDVEKIGLDEKLFDYPKPVGLIRLICEITTAADSIVLDFFAGSGTTAQAVVEQNAADGGSRKFIMVQLDEVPDTKSAAAESGYTSIASLARERIRRAGQSVVEQAGLTGDDLDVGFRSLKVDTTNMADVLRTPDETGQQMLTELENSVKPGRSGLDLLFQVLLDWGLELTMPVTVETIEGHEVFVVEDDALIACFDNEVSPELLRTIAERQPLRAVFCDSSFSSDDARINAEQIFREISPASDLKAI